MKRLLFVVACISLVAAGLVAAPASASSKTDEIEVRLLAMINEGRAGVGKAAEIMHTGLRTAAQRHSADMAARNKLDHSGYPARVRNADPDPYESNGAPDDGFTGYSCENVGWFKPGTTATADQIARKFFEMWLNSSDHRRCMYDEYGYNLNVAGLGIYYADGKWWGTFDAAVDRTPPTSSPTPPPPAWHHLEEGWFGVTYSGTWYVTKTSSASGGYYRYSRVTGALVKFTFTGTGVRWIGLVSKYGGIANVKLDGVLVATVNQYAPSVGYGRVMFERTDLAKGKHTIEISVSGKRDSRSSDQRTYADAFHYYA